MADDATRWHAEGSISFTSFVTNLLRTDQGILDAPSFPFDKDLLHVVFWSEARRSAAMGTDIVWATNLPRGVSPQTRAKLFHERYHYAQIISYPLLQFKFLQDTEHLRVRIAERGGCASVLCGETSSDTVANIDGLAPELGLMETLLSGEPSCRTTVETIEGVDDAGVLPAAFVAPQRRAPGAAGLLRFGGDTQVVVPFTVKNLLESAAEVAEHLFRNSSPPRLRAPGTEREIRYLGCWELWCRLHSKRYTSEKDLAASFLAAVDLALGAHALALYDESLRGPMSDPSYSVLMRYPHARFGAIALHASKIEPYQSVKGIQAAGDFQKSLSELLRWPVPDRAYRFMTAFLTRRLLYSSLWTFETQVTLDEEELKWAIVAPLSEIADDIQRLRPVWASIADSFSSALDRGAVNFVIGSRVLAKMITASRLRALGEPVLAAPHRDTSELSKHFALPLIRLGNRYYMDWDLSNSPDMMGESLGVFESPFRLPAVDMMNDCISLAALRPLVEHQTRCGLIDSVTQEANCLYVAAGAGCPQAGMTPDEKERRRQEKVFDWCHWTYAVLRTATAPLNLRHEWENRWRRESSATARGDEE